MQIIASAAERLVSASCGRLGYYLWVTKPITWLDPDDCDDSDDGFRF
jgi:hypothetical protein